MNNIVEINLGGEVFKGRLDMMALANVQRTLSKEYGKKFTMQEVFNAVSEQQFDVVIELVVESILRCQKVKRHLIENKLGLDSMEEVFTFVAKLVEASMPKAEEGKQLEE